MNRKLQIFAVLNLVAALAFFFGFARWFMRQPHKNMWANLAAILAYGLVLTILVALLSHDKVQFRNHKRWGVAREAEALTSEGMRTQYKYSVVMWLGFWLVAICYALIDRPAQWDKYWGWTVFVPPIFLFIEAIRQRETLKGTDKKDLFQ